ncbi:hypothetical protein FLL45_18935 [Aliikangiella marina]|uniref:Uncharacterized protein n=1 Tax=Aliikangiella marina TaxID=1712262 RepID=A0A545T500_9GAMM|nr:hypothetical protein [Aliikangiella marina]TQV72294.1 hypothetical protein FLL45_18935 [Aliikangiella marina]
MKIFILLLAALKSGALLACSCMYQDPRSKEQIKSSFDRAAAVIIATAVEVENLNPVNQAIQSEDYPEVYNFEKQRTTFSLVQSFKGDNNREIVTEIDIRCCLCGVTFQEGETYLLYLYRSDSEDNKNFYTSSCSRTKSLVSLESIEYGYLEELSYAANEKPQQQ